MPEKLNNPPPTPPQQRRLLRKQDEAADEKQALEIRQRRIGKADLSLQRWAKPVPKPEP